MHSLETGIIVAIAAFFFLSFLSFAFMRETEISKEISNKYETENSEYKEGGTRTYKPEIINDVMNILIERGDKNVRED